MIRIRCTSTFTSIIDLRRTLWFKLGTKWNLCYCIMRGRQVIAFPWLYDYLLTSQFVVGWNPLLLVCGVETQKLLKNTLLHPTWLWVACFTHSVSWLILGLCLIKLCFLMIKRQTVAWTWGSRRQDTWVVDWISLKKGTLPPLMGNVELWLMQFLNIPRWRCSIIVWCILIFYYSLSFHRLLQYLLFASLDSFLHIISRILLLSNYLHIGYNWLLSLLFLFFGNIGSRSMTRG